MSNGKQHRPLDEEEFPSGMDNAMLSDEESHHSESLEDIISDYKKKEAEKKAKEQAEAAANRSGKKETVVFKKCTNRVASSNTSSAERSPRPKSSAFRFCSNEEMEIEVNSSGANTSNTSSFSSWESHAVQVNKCSKLHHQNLNVKPLFQDEEEQAKADSTKQMATLGIESIFVDISLAASTGDRASNYASSPSLAVLNFGDQSGTGNASKRGKIYGERCKSSMETKRITDGSNRPHMLPNLESAQHAINKIRSLLSPEEEETLKRHKNCKCGRNSGCSNTSTAVRSSSAKANRSKPAKPSGRNKSASPRLRRSPKVSKADRKAVPECLKRQQDIEDELSGVFNEVTGETSHSGCSTSICLPIRGKLDQVLKFRHQVSHESGNSHSHSSCIAAANVQLNLDNDKQAKPNKPATGKTDLGGNTSNGQNTEENIQPADNEPSRPSNSTGLLRGLRRFAHWLPHFSKGNGRRNQRPESLRFVSAVSVPNLTAIPEHNADVRSHSDPEMQSKSIAFGLNRLHEENDELVHAQTPCPTLVSCTEYNDSTSDSVSCSTASKSSFQKNSKANKSRPTRFEPKTASFQMASTTSASTLPPNLNAPQYSSCLCLSPPSAFGIMSSSDGSASIYSGSSIATLPMHATLGNANDLMDPNLRYRYLTYGTSAQLQQEYGKVLPWPTLTEFRLRRKFRRLKRRARKLIGTNLFSSKSFLIKRFVKRRNSQPDVDTQQSLCNANFAHVTSASRSSSLTSLLDLIEEANMNIINSFNRSPGPTPKSQPPKCPPRLKRTQSTINVSSFQSQLRTGTLPIGKHLKPLEEETLWKPNMNDYQIAFIDQSTQQQNSPSIQSNQSSPKTSAEPDTISVKSLDSYFGPASLPSVTGNSTTTSPRIAKTLCRNVQLPAKSKSRTLMVRSHFEINNGTIYLEDSDWEMCSEVSELNSLNLIESQAMDSVSMLPNDSSLEIDPSRETKTDDISKSSLESLKVSLQSSSSTSGFSEPKSENIPVSQPTKCTASSVFDHKDSQINAIKQIESKHSTNLETSNLTENRTNTPQDNTTPLTTQNQIIEPELPTVPECTHNKECHNSPTDAIEIKKKPSIMAKPKLEPKKPQQVAEPIYAKPNKSKYPPKHCCIARPAQPPPETPKARVAASRTAAAARAQKVQFRKKIKAPAPPPPRATIARPVQKPELSPASAHLKSPSNSPQSNTKSASTASATTPTTTAANNKLPKNSSSSSRIKLNNLIKKNSNTAGVTASTKTKFAKVSNSKAKQVASTLPSNNTKTTTTTRSTSKSPFKALINRLNPRNQDEGREEKAKTSIERESSKISTNHASRTQSPVDQEPIYSNVNNDIDLEATTATVKPNEPSPVDISPVVHNSTELDASCVSVVDLIDKFNKLNDITPESPIAVPKMASNKPSNSSSEQPSNGIRFESILSNKQKEQEQMSSSSNLESEFQQYLQQLRSSSPDNLDQKQLIDQLCSELIHKFDQTKNPKETPAVPFVTESRAAPMGFWMDPNAPRSQDLTNPNWLFLFFLHNQRQMFKEILHEMLSTIQKQNQSTSIPCNAETLSAKSDEMNEFKQLIQMLQLTIAGNSTASAQPETVNQPIPPIGTVTANVVTPVIETDSKPLKGSKKVKTKVKKPKEKKNSTKKAKEPEPEPAPKAEDVRDPDMESKETEATANVKSSNRFVNKIVLNNSINQFNFTMNQDGSPTSPQPSLPQASIVNVFNDQSTNQAANLFDISVGNSPCKDEQQSSDENDSEEEMEETSGVVSVQTNGTKCASPVTQHRTVLQIKDPSGRSSSSSGFLSQIRYRLEKNRNKKLMKQFKKQQLAASQISILDAIKETEECNSEAAEPKVTLANTSKLEIKITQDPAEYQMAGELPQPKMGTLRRLLSHSKGGASKREKLAAQKMNEESGAESDGTVSKLDYLVARHRNSQYIPQISEPCPTGLEYSLFGTMRHNNAKEIIKHDRRRSRIPMEMMASSGGHRSAAARSMSERNFRSISVIKLNEMPADDPLEIGHHYRQYIRNSRDNSGQMERPIGGSQLNLSTSSLSSSVIVPIIGRRATRGYPASHGSHFSRNSYQSNYNSSDDFDDEQSTTSSRSKMVTFTLPRSFKPKSRTSHGGTPSGHRSVEQVEYNPRYNAHRFQSARHHFIEETDCSETDQTDGNFTEDTETDVDEQYYLTRSRLNDRYFRQNQQ